MSKIRLLICRDCRSIEQLPDYKGPPELDVLLINLLERHRFPNGEEHIGGLADVDESDWNNAARQAEIRKKLTEQFSGGPTGLPSELYAAKDTYLEDAARCFQRHRRTIPCIDWHSDRKRIQNPTKAGWQGGPKVYLCDFCVVRSTVDTEKRYQAGMYDN